MSGSRVPTVTDSRDLIGGEEDHQHGTYGQKSVRSLRLHHCFLKPRHQSPQDRKQKGLEVLNLVFNNPPLLDVQPRLLCRYK